MLSTLKDAYSGYPCASIFCKILHFMFSVQKNWKKNKTHAHPIEIISLFLLKGELGQKAA